MSALVAALALTISSTSASADCPYPTAPHLVSEDRPGSDAAYAVVVRDHDPCTRAWVDIVFGRRLVIDHAPAARTASTAAVRYEAEPGLRLYVEDGQGRLVLSTVGPLMLAQARSVGPGEPLPVGTTYARWSSYRAVADGPGTTSIPLGRHQVALARDDEPLRELVAPLDVTGGLRITAHVERHPIGRPVSGALLGAGVVAALVGGAWAAIQEADHGEWLVEPNRVGPYTMLASGVATAAVGAILFLWVFEDRAVLDVQRE